MTHNNQFSSPRVNGGPLRRSLPSPRLPFQASNGHATEGFTPTRTHPHHGHGFLRRRRHCQGVGHEQQELLLGARGPKSVPRLTATHLRTAHSQGQCVSLVMATNDHGGCTRGLAVGAAAVQELLHRGRGKLNESFFCSLTHITPVPPPGGVKRLFFRQEVSSLVRFRVLAVYCPGN